jgi:hypothetical protein
VALYGAERSREVLKGLVEAANARLQPFGKSAETLAGVARFIVERNT